MAQNTPINESSTTNAQAYLGNNQQLADIDDDGDPTLVDAPFVPTREALDKSYLYSKTGRSTPTFGLNNTNLPRSLVLSPKSFSSLLRKYNKNIYLSKYVHEGTYFKIGPLTYGGEVQDIRILETKAIAQIPGARTGKDFLVDSGEGNADIQVSMVFSGKDHIIKGLLPLIALFKISPITSVKNSVIEAALYNKFTENTAITPDQAAINKIDKIVNLSFQLKQYGSLFASIGLNSTIRRPDEDEFNQAKYRAKYGPIQNKEYKTWISEVESGQYFAEDPDFDQAIKGTEELGKQLLQSKVLRSKSDKTGHVPVAMISIDVSTHPELPDSFLVNLGLKRVHLQNYVRDSLQYRTFDNKPTPDARRAFWLNRLIDLYIEKYYPDPETYFGINFGKIELVFAGDKIILETFKQANKLKNIELGKGYSPSWHDAPGEGTVVRQLSYSISNKFAFYRMAGESYPTCQHMGCSSGNMTLSLTTKNNKKFEEIHTYKSAADFFIRHVDRYDRFNGWKVDSVISRLFNTKEYALSTVSDTIAGAKLFYPVVCSTTTDGESPGLRNLSLSLAETSPDFFSEFGFVLITNGMTVDLLYKFYNAIVTHLDPDTYAYNNTVFFGSGKKEEAYSILNPDSIVAALLEKNYVERYNNTDNDLAFRQDSADNSASKILEFIKNEPKFSGEINNQEPDVKAFIKNITGASWFFTDVNLPEDLAKTIALANFKTNNDPSVFGQLVKRIQKITDIEGRRELYETIFRLANSGQITFTDRFLQHLFVTVVTRAPVPYSDRLYNRINVANAYAALERAVTVRADDIDVAAAADFNKSKAVDNAMVFGPNGTLDITQRRITSYPDYLYVTYQELFDLPELEEAYWKNFAYTYDDLGIINPNFSDYNHDPERSLDSNVVTRAQNQIVTTESSPIPPSIVFYREQELENIRSNLEVNHRKWFDQLKKLTINIPYDIEFLIKEAGRITGEYGITDDNGNIVPLSRLTDEQKLGLGSLIDKMVERTAIDSESGKKNYLNAAQDAIIAQFRLAKEETGFGSLSDKEFTIAVEKLRQTSPTDPRLQQYDRIVKEGDKFEAFVPIVYTSHKNQDVATYRKVCGIAGTAVYKDIIRKGFLIGDSKSPEDFIGETLMKNAAGFEDGPSISNSSFEEIHNAILKSTMAIADNRNDMIKAFPVFRLYLIDYNKGDRIFVRDNFYGYNAIQSIHITLDKNDADFADITIADPMHILQGGIFDDKITWKKGVIQGFSLPNSNETDDSDNFLARFELKQGRAIQIRGGYSSDPDNLDILFTGRISEVQFGDTVRILAQGWKAELLGKQVNFELTSVKNSSVKDLVVRTIRDSNPAGMGNSYTYLELNQILALSNLTALDGAIENSIQNAYGTFGGQSGYNGTEGYFGLHLLGGINQGLDTRLKNIWVPDNEKTRFNFFADIDTTGWEGDHWIIPMQPAWDVLEQATNYVWGYICQVVPYDGEATLFFGRPEQQYYYTRGNPKELTRYKKFYQQQRKDYRTAVVDLFQDFVTDSKEYSGGSLLQYMQDPESWTTYIDGNALGQYVTVGRKGSAGIKFEADQISYKGYVTLGALFKDTYEDKSTLALVHQFPGRLVNSNFRRNFYNESFANMAVLMGGESTAANFLINSFYGFSEDYVEKNMYPVSEVVRSLLEPLENSTLRNIRRHLIDSSQSGKNIKGKNKVTDIKVVSLDIATEYKTILENISDEFLTQNIKMFSSSQAGSFTLTYNKNRFNIPSAVTTKVPLFYKAVALYLESLNNISDFLTNGGDAFKVTGHQRGPFNDELEMRFSVNGDISNEIATALSNPATLLRLKNKAIDYYNLSVQVKNEGLFLNGSLFDSLYVEMSKKLNFAPGGEQQPSLVNTIDFSDVDDLDSEDVADYIVRNTIQFRAYVYFFDQYLRNLNKEGANTEKKDNLKDVANTNSFKFPPSLNMKPFRDYHYIANSVDIIQNNMSASTREMMNTVVIRYNNSVTTSNDSAFKVRVAQGDYDSVMVEKVEWAVWPSAEEAGHIGLQFNESLSLENKKIGVYTDINITRKDQAAKVATNVLAKYMRSMYRNNIMILGRAMKPWDHVYIDDKFIDMLGGVEIERVVHHYGANVGWVTNIVPHAIVEANAGNSAVQQAVMSNMFDKVYNLSDTLLWGLVIATALPTLGASLGVGAAVAGTGARMAGGAASKTLKNQLIPGLLSMTEKELSQLATKLSGKATPSEALKALQQRFVTNSPTFFRSLTASELGSYGVGQITRGFAINCMAGNIQAPVTVRPVLFKGIPFEAGMNGRETSYYSMASKLYWTYQDLQEGFRTAGRFVTDFARLPNDSLTLSQLKSQNQPQGTK